MKKTTTIVWAALILAAAAISGSQGPTTKEYIYVLRPARADLLVTGHTPAEQATQARHSEYLGKLAEQRRIILYGRTLTRDDSTFGIVVFRASSEEEARTTMNNDPGVKEGLMKATLYPYRVAYRDTRPD